MNNKISNPFLKQLISEISNNASKGRLDLNWMVIEEAKKKKRVKEADEPAKDATAKKEKPAAEPAAAPTPDKPTAEPSTDAAPAAGGGLPPLGGTDEKPATDDTKPPAKADAAPEAGGADKPDAKSDAGQAQKDAAEAEAELAAAQAEKAKAEKAIEDQSIGLDSAAGLNFLLQRILRGGGEERLDALANDMIQSLNIKTSEQMEKFASTLPPQSKSIPNMIKVVEKMRSRVK